MIRVDAPGAIMGKARKLKKKADTALVEVFRSLFEEIDAEKLKAEVDDLRRRSPDYDPSEHAETLTRRTALRCAATGAMSGLPSGLMAVAVLGADIAYLIYQQFRLILGIATVYGHEPSQRERFNEALACLAYGSGVTMGKSGLAAMLESATIEGGMVAEKLGSRFIGDRLSKFVPVIGAVSGGALNYFAVRAVARATIRYYEAQIDPALAEEIWLEGDREHA
jgi:hypothetical protein